MGRGAGLQELSHRGRIEVADFPARIEHIGRYVLVRTKNESFSGPNKRWDESHAVRPDVHFMRCLVDHHSKSGAVQLFYTATATIQPSRQYETSR
jgi:hypothetical protein